LYLRIQSISHHQTTDEKRRLACNPPSPGPTLSLQSIYITQSDHPEYAYPLLVLSRQPRKATVVSIPRRLGNNSCDLLLETNICGYLTQDARGLYRRKSINENSLAANDVFV